MKFYGREQESESLEKIWAQSFHTATMTVMIGRRRVGKTSLILNALGSKRNFVYLFANRTSEGVLSQMFQQSIERQTDIHIVGHNLKLHELIEQLFQYAEKEQLTLVIDEFQELEYVSSNFFSRLQYLWDMYHQRSKINFIVCGSIYSMMKRIFENSKEPLFGRMTHKIMLKPFRTDTLKQILQEHNPQYSPEDLLFLYTVTGGVPMYVSLLMDQTATTKERMLNAICSVGSRFLNEAPDMLIGEFGKQYTNYFGILQLIASGMTSQKEIDSVVGKSTGQYMQVLENEYSLILRNLPYGSKPGCRNVRWRLNDNFLAFWFHFIAPNSQMLAMDNMKLLQEVIEDGYTQYSGLMLEKYFRQKYAEQERVTEVSSWWDRSGEKEIDLIAVCSLDRQVTVAEVKRNRSKIDLRLLNEKVKQIKPLFPRYKIQTIGLSLEDM